MAENDYPSEHYIVRASCINCGWFGNMTIDKGTTVSECVCPNCECRNLVSKPFCVL